MHQCDAAISLRRKKLTLVMFLENARQISLSADTFIVEKLRIQVDKSTAVGKQTNLHG
jgi:hypothetical protein